MISVFYDLETTDTNPIGQILNLAFIVVDESWNIIDECCLDLKISRLQLPRAMAIMANNIDVIKHQSETQYTEKDGLLILFNFLRDLKEKYGYLNLIGFNSNKFDLRYLRTSLLRIGLSPYFMGKVFYRDLYQAVKFLAINHPEWKVFKHPREERFSLSLEATATGLGILNTIQTHNSRDDVILTIDLAKELFNRFGFDIRDFDSYQPRQIQVGSSALIKDIYVNEEIQLVENEMYLLDQNDRSSLWVDIKKFNDTKDKSSCYYFTKSTNSLFLKNQIDTKYPEIKETLKLLNLNNFFTRSDCDLEQDIYRLDFKGLDLLNLAIWNDESEPLKASKNLEAKELYLRHRLKYYEFGGEFDAMVKSKIKAYFEYRYGGKLPLTSSHSINQQLFHPTISELRVEIEDAKIKFPEKKHLMESLTAYYDQEIPRWTN